MNFFFFVFFAGMGKVFHEDGIDGGQVQRQCELF